MNNEEELKKLKETITQSTFSSDLWKPKKDYWSYILLIIIGVLILCGAVW